MSNDAPPPPPPAFQPPVSTLGGPIAELIAQQMLAPPARPGLLGTLQQFEVQRVLGSGGMGVVLLARDSGSGRSVAIKLIRPEWVADPRIVHRFVKEAGHLQKLKHPNIVPVLEVSDRAAGPYFVMPYYEGGSLAGCIRPGRPLDAVFILDMALNVAEGLQFAHRRGIIHRDLKPANILRAGEQGACLADFGLARTMFNDTIVDVERQQCEGTAPYMSPGVAAGDAEDTRCDIYAFGALLYEMLTGEPPYAGPTLQEIRRQILAGPPKPIQERNPEADAGLRAVAEGAMARELRDRYADMSDVLADLQRIKQGKAPVGPRGSVRGGLRQVRRVPPLLGLAAGLAAVAVAGWYFFHSRPPPKEKKIAPVAVATNPAPSVVRPMPPVTNPPAVVVTTPPSATNPVPPVVKPPAEPRWAVTIFAGQAGIGGSQDGTGADARFQAPGGLAADSAGNLYVADTGNNTVRRISPTGVVTTLAGLPGSHGSLDNLDNQPGSAARFWAPFGIVVDRVGNVYVAEVANSAIRKISPAGQVSTLAGLAGNPGSNDGAGDNAQFRNPWGVAVDRNGTVYVADTSSCTVRKITPAGAVSTFAGLAGHPGSSDGLGGQARFWNPHGVAADSAGNIYVADTGNNTIRKITAAGLVGTLAGRAGSPGLADGGPGLSQLRQPQNVAVDNSSGRLYVADTDNLAIRVLSNAGALTTLDVAGDLGHPDALAVDGLGNLYMADTINHVIRKVALADGGGAR
ncbi:MAG: protein kinase [Verrucomicrobiota bacterium]|jgi:serine/threonine protein kinase